MKKRTILYFTRLLCLMLAGGFICLTGMAQGTKEKTYSLYRFMEMYHYKPVVWNDSSSAQLFNKFINELDEYKIYFSKADMAVLERFKYQLDEEVTGKQWKFLDMVMPLYRKRILEHDSMVAQLLSKPFDYVQPESIQWPFADFAADAAALKIRTRQYYKWQLLSKLADSLDKDQRQIQAGKLPGNFSATELAVRTKAAKRQERSAAKFAMSNDYAVKTENLFLNCISWLYDPHSSYMNMAQKEEFESAVTASEYTTGIRIKKNDRDEFVISFLTPGGPAWRSGELHTGDVILKLQPANGTETDAADASQEELEALLHGASTDKLVIIVRNAAGTQKQVSLSKEKISSDENIVRSFLVEKSGTLIGYVELPGFYSRFDNDPDARGCANDVAKEVIKLKKDGIGSLILDLRNNGGGSIQEALELAGIFINEGPLCLIRDREGKIITLRDPNRGTIYDGQLMVLINGASASASELTSAVLQDYNRALIVGGNTYGKGTAQIVLPLDTVEIKRMNPASKDFEKVTGQKFYRVDGTTVQWRGVVPDVVLPDLYQQERLKERFNASALIADTIKAASFRQLDPLPLKTLVPGSASRVAASPYFNSISRSTVWLNESRATRTVPLKWDNYVPYYRDRMKVYKEIEAAGKENTTSLSISNNSFDKERSRFFSAQTREMNERRIKQLEKDSFLEEACNIMRDWNAIKN